MLASVTANEAIERTVEDYFQGLYRSDMERLRRAFHANARIAGPDDGVLREMNLEQFITFAAQQPSAADAGEPLDMRILDVDIAGDVATVKVVDSYIGRRFIDHLSMVRLDGRWWIYNKLWHVERRL